jgi:hypothetical protein
MLAEIAALTSGPSFACEIQAVEGNTLKVKSSGAFPLRAPVKVEDSSTLWMGEVWVCEPHASGFDIEIEVSQVLRDTPSIEHMAGRFRQAPKAEHLA